VLTCEAGQPATPAPVRKLGRHEVSALLEVGRMFGNISPNAGNGRNLPRWFLIGIDEDVDVYQLGDESRMFRLNQMIELPNTGEPHRAPTPSTVAPKTSTTAPESSMTT
jgi:hypothetical protein